MLVHGTARLAASSVTMSALDANRTRTSSSSRASWTPVTSTRIGMPSLMKLPLSALRWIFPSGWYPRVQPNSRQY